MNMVEKICVETIGLRSKLWSDKMIDDDEEKKCKGIKKSVIKKDITFQDYKNCLFDEKEETRSMNLINHKKHDLFTESIEKVALSFEDDKRIVMDNKIDTLVHGHYMEKMIPVYEDIFGFKP